MLIYRQGTQPRAEYHEGMLLVKVRPTVAVRTAAATALGVATGFMGQPGGLLPAAVAMAMASSEVAGAAAAIGTPGMSLLGTLERQGRVRRVTPLARRLASTDAGAPRMIAAVPPGGAASTLAAVGAAAGWRAPEAGGSDPLAGVSLVEVDSQEEARRLQEAMAADANVEFVSRVPIRYALAGPVRRPATGGTGGAGAGVTPTAAPPSGGASAQWNLQKIRCPEARAAAGFADATAIRVGVLDTGVDASHPDLAGQVSQYVYAHPDLPLVCGEHDIVGHGTHVSGTICARINNQVGIDGICRCDLRVWKVFADQVRFVSYLDGFGYLVDPVMYRRALADCLTQGVDVINLSIGGTAPPDPQEAQLVAALLARGTTVVAAMGNARMLGSPVTYPGALPGVIAVGATGINDSVAPFSNAGPHISVAAPGVAIWSTLPTYSGQTGFYAVQDAASGSPVESKPIARETDYGAWQGTSMATPHVTAAAALLLARHGTMSPAEVRGQLMASADRPPFMTAPFDSDFGAGRINLLRLLS